MEGKRFTRQCTIYSHLGYTTIQNNSVLCTQQVRYTTYDTCKQLCSYTVKLNIYQTLERPVNPVITYITTFGGKSYAYKVFFFVCFAYFSIFPKCLSIPHTIRRTWLRNAGLSDLDLRLLDTSRLFFFVRSSAVFRRPLTAEVRVRSQTSLHELCGRKNDTGTEFSPCASVAASVTIHQYSILILRSSTNDAMLSWQLAATVNEIFLSLLS